MGNEAQSMSVHARGYASPLKPVEAMAMLVARLRDCAREAERAPLAREISRIADELLAIRKAVMDTGIANLDTGIANQDYSRNARAREKNPEPGMRRCSICKTLLPLDMFAVTDAKKGKRRAECKPCYNERQRTRYVRAGYKIVTIEVLDGDPCVGHHCPVCDKPFEVGQHVQGDNVRHADCNPVVTPIRTEGV